MAMDAVLRDFIFMLSLIRPGQLGRIIEVVTLAVLPDRGAERSNYTGRGRLQVYEGLGTVRTAIGMKGATLSNVCHMSIMHSDVSATQGVMRPLRGFNSGNFRN